MSSYYTISNDAGLHVTIMVQSLDGSHLAKGDYNFY